MSTASGTSNYHWHTHLTWLQDLVTDTWERSQKGQQMSVSSRSIVTASNKLNQYTRAPVLKTVITSSTDHDLLYQIRLCHGDLLNIKHNFIDTWTRNTTVRCQPRTTDAERKRSPSRHITHSATLNCLLLLGICNSTSCYCIRSLALRQVWAAQAT